MDFYLEKLWAYTFHFGATSLQPSICELISSASNHQFVNLYHQFVNLCELMGEKKRGRKKIDVTA
jgi:dimeric dUTPase (all-alpha-NTP-PPase superfamily)